MPAPDPFRFLTDWIGCSEPDREDLTRCLTGAVVDIGAGGGSKVDPCSLISIADLKPVLAVAVDHRFDQPSPDRGRVRANVDGRALPFRDHAFDGVVCMHLLEHVARPAELLAEIARIIEPGGWMLAAVPNGWSFSDNLYKLWKFVFLVSNAEPIPHVQRFTKRSVKELFHEAGFETRYVVSIGETFEWLARHRLLRAGVSRLTRMLKTLHAETFSYGWLFAARKGR